MLLVVPLGVDVGLKIDGPEDLHLQPHARFWRRALLVCGAVVLLDQVSKAIVVSSLSVGERVQLILGFTLTNTPNSGLAFGIGQGQSFVLVITVIGTLLTAGYLRHRMKRSG